MMRDDTKKTILRAGAAVMLLAFLGACQNKPTGLTREDAKKTGILEGMQLDDLAGLLQTAPDEFGVITKRPLEMPASFAALPAPNPGARSTRDPDPLADARAALSIAPATVRGAGGAPSASEAALLASIGTADPSIRTTLASEQAAYEASQDVYLLDRVFPRLRELRGDTDPEAIDAEAERLRLVEAGVAPGRRVDVPAASLPAAATPVTPTAIDPGTGPALSEYAVSPTLGVLAPEPVDTTPSLIYLPE